MYFSQTKLPFEAAANMRNCPIYTISPYACMISPVYVYMRKNKKFVAVKAPLDFFTPEELQRLKSFESFFFPEFVDSSLLFRETARRVRALLIWKPPTKVVPLPPAPYEISDAIIRMIGPLWGVKIEIEPFFIAVFVNEICNLLPKEILRKTRENNIEALECGIMRSAWVVFLSLHLGYFDLDYLNKIRLEALQNTINNDGKSLLSKDSTNEASQIIAAVEKLIPNSEVKRISITQFDIETMGVIAGKILNRLNRVKNELIEPNLPIPSIYGGKGFLNE